MSSSPGHPAVRRTKWSGLSAEAFRKVQTFEPPASSPFDVWLPPDFTDLGSRDALDQVLHRLVRARIIRRITRGLFDKPNLNALADKPTHPDPRPVIDALARRDSAGMIVDDIAADNNIGLSDAVLAHIIVRTGARLKSLSLGNLLIDNSALSSRSAMSNLY